MKRICAAFVVAAMPVALARPSAQAVADREKAVDAVFAKFSRSTPGCAVGVSTDGRPALAKSYGMADLEHDVPITPDTIFEAGSVSKQFTAAAVLLLAREGKLSVDDPVRKYIPELPEYPQTIVIRHLLNHTSGLRDWGSVAGIGGWPRTTRAYTQAHVLEIVSRQRALNFSPGTRFSYSNTGFNLAAIIVSRVSGVPFAEFTRDRLFRPLGMSRTSWRDDHTRIVKGRAIAYAERDGRLRTNMPFENAYGNGGLLTTVGDLLTWNENFTNPIVGGAAFVEEQQQPGKFNDGRTHGYAFGLYVGTRQQNREVYHSGSTAGYSAFLTRFPDRRLSVAVLCNIATNATTLAHSVTDIYLDVKAPGASRPSVPEGLYRSELTGMTVEVGVDRPPNFGLRTVTVDERGDVQATDAYGTTERFARVERVRPTPGELADYSGVYASDEAETELRAVVEGGRLVMKRRPDTTIPLSPLYRDGFSAGTLGTIIFRRDGGGRVNELSVVQDRVWDLRFRKK